MDPPGVGSGLDFGHRPRPAEEPETVPARQLLSGALIAFLVGWLLWSLLWNGYLGGWWLLPLYAMIPDSWAEPHSFGSVVAVYAYYTAVALAIMIGVGRLGRWGEVWRRYGLPAWRRSAPVDVRPPAPEDDPAQWNQLRAAGAADAADRLAAEARTGLMRDVDHARIARAWQGVRSGRHSLATFTGAVL
ncbi:ATP-binding protein, partial [Streptomyces sp. NPDC005568]